jgi:hypothetical protein
LTSGKSGSSQLSIEHRQIVANALIKRADHVEIESIDLRPANDDWHNPFAARERRTLSREKSTRIPYEKRGGPYFRPVH